MLIRALPRGSATRNAIIGEFEDWGPLEYLTAAHIDATQGWGWANTGNKKGRPDPIRRPGDPPPENRTTLSGREVVARLRKQLLRR